MYSIYKKFYLTVLRLLMIPVIEIGNKDMGRVPKIPNEEELNTLLEEELKKRGLLI